MINKENKNRKIPKKNNWRKEISPLNPIQDGGKEGGGGQKAPLPVFSCVTSTNVGIIPQNFLSFIFKPFFHTGVKFQVCL